MPDPSAESFDLLHRRLGVDGPLHAECPFARQCWPDDQRPRLPDGTYDLTEWTRLPRPWVGPRFERLRLLCLAVNMHGSGGRDECDKLVCEAREKIRSGVTRVGFEAAPTYVGTFLYHRMGAYAAEIASAQGLLRPFPADDLPSHDQIAEIFDFLAYTNHVKCSPCNTERSKPTEGMWENCGRFILRPEIRILQPRFILILGLENHTWFLNSIADSESFVQTAAVGRVILGQASFDGRKILLATVPHPFARIPFKDIRRDLRSALRAPRSKARSCAEPPE